MTFKAASFVLILVVSCVLSVSSLWKFADADSGFPESDCPVHFKTENYSVLINNCKAPAYPKDPCCNAFKKFACPFADYLNNVSNHCADIMFYYINFYGHYPVGLFFNKCLEGPKGLAC